MWEEKQLRDVTEADVRQLIDAGVEEHIRLEYKQQDYTANMAGRKEMLLDICQFANTQGGLMLIGVPEAADGVPDPAAPLGIQLANPEQILRDYDARVTAKIEDRLPLELANIPIAGGTQVLAIRIPDSVNKPHCVNHEGHIYFPARRERHRYYMDVMEIKEMTLRAASSLERAEKKLQAALELLPHAQVLVGLIPIFWKEFSLDILKDDVVQSVRTFTPGDQANPVPNFAGLERLVHRDGSKVYVHRDGVVVEARRLAPQLEQGDNRQFIYVQAIDDILYGFVTGAARVYNAAGIGGPFLLAMVLRFDVPMRGAFPEGIIPNAAIIREAIQAQVYPFPIVQAADLTNIDRTIRPLCDQAHQMWGQDRSSRFDGNGAWIGRR